MNPAKWWPNIRDALIALVGMGGIIYETVLTPDRPADAILVPAFLAMISLGSGLPIDRLLRKTSPSESPPPTTATEDPQNR